VHLNKTVHRGCWTPARERIAVTPCSLYEVHYQSQPSWRVRHSWKQQDRFPDFCERFVAVVFTEQDLQHALDRLPAAAYAHVGWFENTKIITGAVASQVSLKSWRDRYCLLF